MPVRRRPAAVIGTALVLMVAAAVWWVGWADRGDGDDAGAGPAPSRTTPGAAPTPTGWAPTAAEVATARKKAEDLSLEELAGQLIVARSFDEDSSLALVRDKHFAGVMVTSPQILEVETDDPLDRVKAFNRQLREAGDERGVPVMVPIDQEGGLVARLADPLTTFPTFMSAGAAVAGDSRRGSAAVTAATRASGAELRAAGYNTVFAPAGDITVGPADPIIGSRSAGSKPGVVSKAVLAAVDGYSEAGVISFVKHFPGHNVASDSHRDLPVLDSDRDQLRKHDLAPFEAAISEQAPGIMTGHLEIPLIDRGVPASLSRKVITTGLREALSFDGLVISDSLGMGPIMSRYPGGSSTVAAIKAGSDLALMPADNVQAYDAVLAALESGEIPVQQARDSATRVIAFLLHSDASPQLPGAPGSHQEQAEALTANALTVLASPCPVPPVTGVRPTGSAEAVAGFRTAAEEAGLPIGSGTSVAFLGPGSAGAYADVVVSTDVPYGLARSTAPTKIALYGEGVPAMRALVKRLMGQAGAPGNLPVSGTGLKKVPAC